MCKVNGEWKSEVLQLLSFELSATACTELALAGILCSHEWMGHKSAIADNISAGKVEGKSAGEASYGPCMPKNGFNKMEVISAYL